MEARNEASRSFAVAMIAAPSQASDTIDNVKAPQSEQRMWGKGGHRGKFTRAAAAKLTLEAPVGLSLRGWAVRIFAKVLC